MAPFSAIQRDQFSSAELLGGIRCTGGYGRAGAGYLADSDVIATATSPSGAPNGPGSVVETQPLSRLAPELQAAAAQSVRVVYRSTDV